MKQRSFQIKNYFASSALGNNLFTRYVMQWDKKIRKFVILEEVLKNEK